MKNEEQIPLNVNEKIPLKEQKYDSLQNDIEKQDLNNNDNNNANSNAHNTDDDEANNQNREDSEINIQGYRINPQENIKTGFGYELCSRVIVIALFFAYTREDNFPTDKCELLKGYGINFMYFNIAMLVISFLVFCLLTKTRSNAIFAIDQIIKMVGTLIFMVFFQIGYVKSQFCGGLAVLVLIYLIFFYLTVLLLIVGICCMSMIFLMRMNQPNN